MLNFLHAMEAIPQLPDALKPALDLVAQRWGFARFQPVLLQNLEFCDQMLQLLDDHYSLSEEIRRETYANFIGPGPGGLRAFHWLLQHEHLDRALVRDYLACLQVGPPRSGALNEEEMLPLLKLLLEHWEGESEELILVGFCQFLNSNALSSKARATAFRDLLQAALLSEEGRRRLAHWGCRRAGGADLPLSHIDLHKAGFLQCILLGEAPEPVLLEALRQSAQGPLQLRESAASACLEIVELYRGEVSSELYRQALLQLKDSDLARARRRAFQLLEESEGEDWVHLGLRDRDAGVRSWALLRANQRRRAEQTA